MREEDQSMDSQRLTNGLLLVIALALLAHLGLALSERPLLAETFRLDSCITDRPSERPASYVHVVTHGMADVSSARELP